VPHDKESTKAPDGPLPIITYGNRAFVILEKKYGY
jgi:hypothetical protein